MSVTQALAQTTAAPPEQASTDNVGVLVILVVGLLLVFGALVKLLDLKRKRESEAVVVQAQVSEPSEEVREAVLRLVDQEARRLRPDVTIESRLGVVPAMTHHVAA
jgi:hypothetical protein